ncbi:uncharacterized protein LOC115924473 [Strongylocentrotus purpuratus]|uniref:SGNH hydrolase-type esterase domain-containing protein n=1 Tax=Strongylocentrotus purpuratus TaxID=7668 RepID=A0A7M7NVX2_STRPU|nr:uncharacterized protein LOC115924473 [Strongylocentrotus purpuratus]
MGKRKSSQSRVARQPKIARPRQSTRLRQSSNDTTQDVLGTSTPRRAGRPKPARHSSGNPNSGRSATTSINPAPETDGPQYSGNETTGANQSSSQPPSHAQPMQETTGDRIWIVGDSLVRRAKQRANMLNHQDLGRARGTVQWHGQGGATLQDLPRLVENRLRYNQRAPALVIVHLGTNNLGLNDACQCRIAIDMALQILRTAMPRTHIAWSTIIPRLFYHSSRGYRTLQDAMDGVRKSLNKYARRLIARLPNASVIAH